MVNTSTALADALLADERQAIFSQDRTYRYRLWQVWNPAKPRVLYVMLNPSTADEKVNDPTVERCYRRALKMPEFGGFEVVNLFALRSTYPQALYEHLRPIDDGEIINGEGANDSHIWHATSHAGMVICGWGEHGKYKARSTAVRNLLLHATNIANRIPLCALKINASGEPAHPLYIPYSAQPIPYPGVKP